MSNSLALARLDFNLRDGFLVPPLLKNENIGEKIEKHGLLGHCGARDCAPTFGKSRGNATERKKELL